MDNQSDVRPQRKRQSRVRQAPHLTQRRQHLDILTDTFMPLLALPVLKIANIVACSNVVFRQVLDTLFHAVQPTKHGASMMRSPITGTNAT